MPSTKTSCVASRLATFLLVVGSGLVLGCGSGTLNPDGGSGGGGHQAGAGGHATGAAGSSTGGAAGSKTGQAGTSGTAGSSGSGAAGTHGANDGGAAGKGGQCACAAIYAPVCGSDGKTYPSRCDADCAGAVVAHDGVCTAPSKDAGADGPLGHCAQDTDCESRPADNCSCAQVCAAKTDPEPPPPKFRCAFVCPAIAISCTCVNHVCTAATPITPG